MLPPQTIDEIRGLHDKFMRAQGWANVIKIMNYLPRLLADHDELTKQLAASKEKQ
jgi:hypothetical protein